MNDNFSKEKAKIEKIAMSTNEINKKETTKNSNSKGNTVVNSLKASEVEISSKQPVKEQDPNSTPNSFRKFHAIDPQISEEPIKSLVDNMEKGFPVGFFAKLIANPWFSILRILFILGNAIALGMIRYPQPKAEADFIRISNYILTFFFFFENLIMIIGGGLKNFVKEIFNIVDLVISVVSSLS